MKKFFKVFLGVFVIFAVALISLYIFRNPIVENVIETLGTAAAGAKVDVDGVKTFPVECRMKWDRIQVTDKDDTWTNLVETGNCEFGFEFIPLLAGKVIIDTMVVDGVKAGTARTTDGKVEKTLNDKSDTSKPSWIKTYALKQLEKEKQAIPVLNTDIFDRKIDADAIIAELELITPGNVEKLQTFADKRYQFWETKIKNNTYEKRIKQLQKDAESINLKKIKDIAEFQSTIAKAEKVIKTSKRLRDEIKKERKDFKRDLKTIRESAEKIPVWIKTDYETALKKANVTEFNAENISRMLFGDRVTSIMMTALNAIEKSRKMSKGQSASPKKVKDEKMPSLPGFWIKKMIVGASLQNGLDLKGTALDISTDQKKTGQPIQVELGGQSDKTGIVKIKGVADYRHDVLSDVFKVDLIKYPVNDITLADSSIFPGKIKKGHCNLSAGISVKNKRFDSNIEFQMSDVTFDNSAITNPEKRTARIAKRVAKKVDEVVVTCSVKAADESMRIKIDSNIDDILSAEMRGILADEVDTARAGLQKRLTKKLGHYQGDFLKNSGGREKELGALFAKLDKDSATQDKVIESKKKALEKKLKKKLEKKLMKKLKLKF